MKTTRKLKVHSRSFQPAPSAESAVISSGAQVVLAEDGERYRRLFDRVPIGLYVTAPAGQILDVNPALLQMLGYEDIDSFTALLAEQVYLHPEERAKWQKMMDQDRVVRDFEMQMRCADGSVIWVRDNARAICDPSGNVLDYEGSLEDITHQKQTEAALVEQKRALHLVISSMPNLLLKVNEKDQLSAFAAPPQFLPFLKASDNPLNKPLADFLPTGVVNRVQDALKQARSIGASSVFEHTITVDDQIAYFEIRVSPVAETHEVLVVADNITERKLAELAEHDQRMLAEALGDVAVTLNSTLDLKEVMDRILANLEHVVPYDAATIMLIDEEGIARIVGRRGYAERGMTESILSTRYPVRDVKNLRQMVDSGRPMAIADTIAFPGWVSFPEIEWIRAYCGAPILVQAQAIGFINLDSASAGFFTPDHLDRLEAFAAQAAVAIRNAQLYLSVQEQAAELETANRELEAFSHTVAHDLKAPLQVAIGYATLLEDEYGDVLDDEGKTVVSGIKSSGFRMAGMIESLLLLANLRNVEETIVRVEMEPVAAAARDRFQDQIRERGFQIEIEPDMPAALGYGPWLEEVFANLIGNAIKYTAHDNPHPRILIRGSRQGSLVRYEVQDNGLGISEKDQARLFEMFSRFHTGHAAGFGLGLSIVQRVVTRLHGQVGAESAPGEGSTFWFTLPAA